MSASHKFTFISLILFLCCNNIPTTFFLCLTFPIVTFYSSFSSFIVIYKNKFFENYYFGSFIISKHEYGLVTCPSVAYVSVILLEGYFAYHGIFTILVFGGCFYLLLFTLIIAAMLVWSSMFWGSRNPFHEQKNMYRAGFSLRF